MFYWKGGEVLRQDLLYEHFRILRSRGHLNYDAHSKLDEIKLAHMENIQSGRKLLLEVFFKFLCRKKPHKKGQSTRSFMR